MEIIFHTGKGSDQSLREFDEKRADFLMRELRNMNVQDQEIPLPSNGQMRSATQSCLRLSGVRHEQV